MKHTIIDKTSWKRKEYFEHYTTSVPCTYSLTSKLDITNLRNQDKKLYPTMLYMLTKIVNRYEEFRMALTENGDLILYSNMEPCYTVFHEQTETFSNIWTEYSTDYKTFIKNYENDILNYGNIEKFMAKPNVPQNSFTVSMLPWTIFDGFNLNTPGFDYLIPIFTMGKFSEINGKVYLPLAVQVHHAVCDGFHVCRFINDVQAQINEM